MFLPKQMIDDKVNKNARDGTNSQRIVIFL